MRKCRLCGAVIRRRAMFCRFCSARQDGAPSDQRDGVVAVPVGPERGTAQTDLNGKAAFEPTWDFGGQGRTATQTPSLDFEMTEASRVAEPEPETWVFEPDIIEVEGATVEPTAPTVAPNGHNGTKADTGTMALPDPGDPLLGFEEFPDAPSAPDVRWG